jgi:hypothetical protein
VIGPERPDSEAIGLERKGLYWQQRKRLDGTRRARMGAELSGKEWTGRTRKRLEPMRAE